MSNFVENSQKPLVSIIVPAFNVEAFLAKCLKSICGQTYRNIEVVVIDDKSSDSTGHILDSISATDSRIKAIHLSENAGVHQARSIGIRASTGTYIGFVDSDDWIAPTMFEEMVEHALAENADITICGVAMTDVKGIIGSSKVKFKRAQTFTTAILARFCNLSFGTGALWNKLYKRKTIEPYATMKLGRESDSVEDYIVNVGCFANARRVAIINKILYYYVIHPESASRTGDEASNFIRIARAHAICLETYQSIFHQYLPLIDILYAKQLQFSSYYVSNPETLIPFRQHLIETFNRILAIRPEALCTLIQYKNKSPSAHKSIWHRLIPRFGSLVHKD